MTNQSLAVRPADDWSVIISQAATLVKTGFLPQAIKTPEQAAAIILTGRELGIGTMAALQTINVIQGKPTVSPQLMLALVNRSGQLEDISIETGDQGATVTIQRKGRSPYTAKFGPKEAKAMGLDGKDNYKKQAPTMYKWRAVADACRATFADCILGLYTPDEMGAVVDVETGEVIDIPNDEYVSKEAAEVLQTSTPTSTEIADSRQKHHPTQAEYVSKKAAETLPQNQLMALFRELKMTQAQVRSVLKNTINLDRPVTPVHQLLNNLLPNEAQQVLDTLQKELAS